MDTKGGRITIAAGGQVFSARAAAKVMLSGVSVKVDVNQDGSGYRTVAPKLVGLDVNFDRGSGFAWDSSMILQNLDVTFVEEDLNLTHMFTSASFDGDPTIDSATGEVSGLKILTAESNYNKYAS